MTIYYFGNPLVSDDQMAPAIIASLKETFPSIIFRHTDPTEQWWQGEQNPILLDTVVGLDRTHLFTSIDEFEDLEKRITPHDYDLLMDLALLMKLQKLKSFTLIGLPNKGNLVRILQQAKHIISSLSSV